MILSNYSVELKWSFFIIIFDLDSNIYKILEINWIMKKRAIFAFRLILGLKKEDNLYLSSLRAFSSNL